MRSPEALFDDEQFVARGYFVEVEHPELGRKFLSGRAVPFQRHAVARVPASAAAGEHTGEILRDELGLPEDGGARAEGVI